MIKRSERTVLSAAAVCLLVAGVLTPIAVLAQLNPSPTPQQQLSAMVSAAESSRAYASSVVSAATLHNLDTSSADSQIAVGDRLLANATSDLSSGTNIAAGLVAAHSAMRAYAGAAATASLVLEQSGFTASVDLAGTSAAVAEVNATASLVASLAAHACSTTMVSAANEGAFNHTCAGISMGVANATLHLRQAAAVVAQVQAGASASASLSGAIRLIAESRAEVETASSLLQTVAAYSYSQRGQVFVETDLSQLYASANATVRTQGSAFANLVQLGGSFNSSLSARASGVANVTTAASNLLASIQSVNTTSDSVTSSISAALSTATKVKNNLTALGILVNGIQAGANLSTAIQTALTAEGDYATSLSVATGDIAGFSAYTLAGFHNYLTAVTAQQGFVDSNGTAYTRAYYEVQVQLKLLIATGLVLGLGQFNSTLTVLGKSVISTASNVHGALEGYVQASAAMNGEIAAMVNATSSASAWVEVDNSTLSTISTIAATESTYLSQSGNATVYEASAYLHTTATEATSFIASSRASIHGNVSTFTSAQASLSSRGQELVSNSSTSARAVATATAAVKADLQARTSAITSANADTSYALAMFSSLNIGAGVSAMAQASVELQAASATSASA